MTLPPSHRGRASDGTDPGIASRGDTRAVLHVHEAGEVLWLAAQRELRMRAVREACEPVSDPPADGPSHSAAAAAAEPDVPLPTPDPSDPTVAPSDPPGPDPADVPPAPGNRPHGPPDSPAAEIGAVYGSAPREGPPRALPGEAVPGRGGASALDRSRQIEQAFRPLRRRLDSRVDVVLDEAATAESRAEQGMWMPRFRPARERWLTMSLVVDTGEARALWSRTAERLAAALSGSGAFRDVVVRAWPAAAAPDAAIAPVPGGPAPAGAPHDGARHMVLVLSDMHAGHWRDGAALRQLARWADEVPVAVVNLLPEYLWSRMPVVPQRTVLHSPAPAAANRHWSCRADPFGLLARDPDAGGPGRPDPHHTPVPVLELTPEALSGWARFVRRDDGAGYAAKAVLVPPEAATVGIPESAADAPRASDDVRRLQAQLSPLAYHLARLGAAIPLNLTVLQLLQQRLLPEARPWHLAELLLSGLLHAAPADASLPAAARVDLEFPAGVRQHLLADGTRRETVLALRLAFDQFADYVPGSAGQTLRRLSDVVVRPGTAARLPALDAVEAWLTPALPALTALDGQHSAMVGLLRERMAAGPFAAASSPTRVNHPAQGAAAVTDRRTIDTNSGYPEESADVPVSPGDPPSILAEETTESVGGNVSVSGVQPMAARSTEMALKPPPVWGNVPPRNRAFTGRGLLLEQLHARLQEGTTAVLPEALQGMGGVGKSQLAVEYVYKHMHEYQVVWWISAEQPQQIRQVLVELARRLHLEVGSGEANAAVPAVIEALRIGEPYKNWLLIFDNAEDLDAVREFFPTNGPGRILVTSRNAQWSTAARPLEVDVFARDESRQLLQLRAPNLDDATADRLAETLGDLPLGIEQAAVWLAETGMPAEEYLRLFEQQAADLMVSAPPADYPLSVAAAWNVSLERLQQNHPAALQLLQVCAFFAPEPISRRLLTGVRDAPVPPELAAALGDPIRLSRAIREINRYALARINHSTNTLQLHRLVQRVLINQMPQSLQNQMRRGAHALLANGDPNAPTDPGQWPRYGELLPHVLSSNAVESHEPWVRQLVRNEIQYMYSWGDHDGSRDLARRAYEQWRRDDGDDHGDVMTVAQQYANALRILGRYDEAYDLDLRNRDAMVATLGEEHEMTLEITSMLAWDLRMRGDFAAAADLDRQVYEVSLRKFGPNDLASLVVAHRVALNLRLTGSAQAALELDEDTHRRKLEELGENDLYTLNTLAALAIDQMETGNYQLARDTQQEVSSRCAYIFGPKNPNTIASLRSLSVTERRQGRHEEALQLSASALTEFRNRYGENYPDTLSALLAHSIDVRHSGDLSHALELSEQACIGYERLFGGGHPHALSALVNHAVCLRLMGRVEEARDLNVRLTGELGAKLGEEHPSVLACASNLIADLLALGNVQASVDLATKTLATCKRQLGADHPATLAVAHNLALGLPHLGQDAEAEALHADTMERYIRILGEDHPGTIAAGERVPANCDIDPMPL
jgi:tetratricopeptide (TPR) repeat protein